jgi:hypothetical protein
MEKAELVITALQQRIGEMVSHYETQIAMLRAELTYMSNAQMEKQEAVQQYNDELVEKVGIEEI